jgi:hypothetical protein
LTQKLHNDFKKRFFRLICRGLARRRLDEPLKENSVPYQANAHLHAVDIPNGTWVDEEQKD